VSTRSVILTSPNPQSQPCASVDACSHIEPRDRTSNYDTRLWLGSCSYPFSLYRVLRSELRSLFGRIREARESGLYHRGVAVLPRFLTALLGQEVLIAQWCCNEDTQRILESRKWMNLSDTLIFLPGWTLGAEWAYRTLHSEHFSPAQSASSNLTDSGAVGKAR
jgi:hypothetical protein